MGFFEMFFTGILFMLTLATAIVCFVLPVALAFIDSAWWLLLYIALIPAGVSLVEMWR